MAGAVERLTEVTCTTSLASLKPCNSNMRSANLYAGLSNNLSGHSYTAEGPVQHRSSRSTTSSPSTCNAAGRRTAVLALIDQIR
jgi:hypothetical protein